MKVGEIRQSQGGSYYIKFNNITDKNGNVKLSTLPLTLEDGDVLFLNKPEETIDYLVKSGKLTEEQGEERKRKIPSFIKFEVHKQSSKE